MDVRIVENDDAKARVTVTKDIAVPRPLGAEGHDAVIVNGIADQVFTLSKYAAK